MTLGEFMAANLEQKFDARRTHAGKVEVIYPWVDTEKIKPISKDLNWFAQKYNQVGKLTVMYSGNMGLGHEIETMLAAAHMLQDEPGINFMFVGAGPKWLVVKDFQDEHNLPNITLLPWQLESDLQFSLAAADVALVSIEQGVDGLMFPSKAIYFLSAGAALILLSDGSNEIKSCITNEKCGILVPPGNIDQLMNAILLLTRDHSGLNIFQSNSRRAAVDRYSRLEKTSHILRCMNLLEHDV